MDSGSGVAVALGMNSSQVPFKRSAMMYDVRYAPEIDSTGMGWRLERHE